jgi:MFS family permease
MALYMMVFQGATPIGSPIIGWIGNTISPRWAIGIGAVATFAVAAVAALWSWRNWHVHLHQVKGWPFLELVHEAERRQEEQDAAALAGDDTLPGQPQAAAGV